jgi:hypothetical protein
MEVGERLDVGNGGIVAHSLLLLMNYKTKLDFYSTTHFAERYTVALPLYIPQRLWQRMKCFVGVEEVVAFNQHIHKLFHEMVLQRVQFYIQTGRTEKAAIQDFLELIGAEEDVHWESIKRVSHRVRTAKKIPNFYANSVTKVSQ